MNYSDSILYSGRSFGIREFRKRFNIIKFIKKKLGRSCRRQYIRYSSRRRFSFQFPTDI